MKQVLRVLAGLAVLLAGALWTGASPVWGAGFVVSSSSDDADAHDWLPGDGMCADAQGRCTLRAAIEEANASPGADTITFQAAMNIYINATEGVLPSLDETVTIDASSVWDAGSNVPGVMLNGQGGSFGGLYLGDDSCQIYGLYITNFGGAGILVVSAANRIGGSGAGQRNVLSGNDMGISLSGSSAQNNVLHNNYMGLTPAGTSKNPNDTGLYIGNGASDNIVGGNDASHANYISGNTYNGVTIEGTGTDNNWLGGNAIGVGTDLSNLGNGARGIRIQNGPANTVIGGTSTSGNIISFSNNSGVGLFNAGSGTQITSNLISGNGGDGVEINNSASCVVSHNLISGNSFNGVLVNGATATGNTITVNSIYDNGGQGIALVAGGNTELAAPVITSANAGGASGTGCAWCTIHLYSDPADEGRLYHGFTTADGSGNWSYSGFITGPNVTATNTGSCGQQVAVPTGCGDTSEFSAPYAIGLQNRIFLPFVCRNH